MPDPTRQGPLVMLVSGSGRSGTSSLAGSLKRLGLHVPQPEVGPSATNPRGFYEPQWVIDFHKGYLKRLAMHNIDTRPDAGDLVADLVATGEPQRRLRPWLADQLQHRHLVIKDPHSYWFAEAWREVSTDLGADLVWLTSLRHPAEVVGSRELAYLHDQPEELRRAKETSNVAGWIHASLLTERAGRGGRRAFVRYADLLQDWRTALGRVSTQLDVPFQADLSGGAARDHAVDEFLEPSLRRSQVTWADLQVPGWLEEMAQEVWELLGELVADPVLDAPVQRLDQIGSEYAVRYAEAAALTYDRGRAQSILAARRAREAQRETVERLRRDLARLRQAGPPASVPGSSASSDRAPGPGFARRVTRRLRGD